MAFELEQAGTDLLDTAPIQIAHAETVRAPLEAIWAAVSEAAPWVEWFHGMHVCVWTSDQTRTVGATRRVKLGPLLVDEEFIDWDEDAMRFAFRVMTISLPLARRMVESLEIHDLGDGKATVTWRSSVEPRSKLLPARMIARAFEKGLARGFGGLQPYLDAR